MDLLSKIKAMLGEQVDVVEEQAEKIIEEDKAEENEKEDCANCENGECNCHE